MIPLVDKEYFWGAKSLMNRSDIVDKTTFLKSRFAMVRRKGGVMPKQMTVQYTNSKMETSEHYFVSEDGDLFYEIVRPMTEEQLKEFKAPEGRMAMTERWFGFGSPGSPFRRVEK